MSEKAPIVPGQMIEDYRIIEFIARGGFSEVWSAWDTKTDRLVAIKLMPRGKTDSLEMLHFSREAAMVAKLDHPNILPLYNFGETPEYRYLVTRYVIGGSLAQRIGYEQLPIHTITSWMSSIASTLDYIHERHIVHRDLKPGNILLDTQGIPYLTDFGLAKELTDETMLMHSMSGTLTYMPPEQFSGSAITIASDQYSFGIILYQLFSGNLPYEGKVAHGMRQNTNLQEKLPDITLMNPQLPTKLNDWLWQLTEAEPEKRPTSAVKVMEAVAELLKSIDTPATVMVTVRTTTANTNEYRLRETENLIARSLPAWKDENKLALSLTHFVLLDMLLRDLPMLSNADVQSMMLRAALEYNQQVERCWAESSDAARQRACWHAVKQGDDGVRQRALKLMLTEPWSKEADSATLNDIGKQLMPISNATSVTLDFLDHVLSSDTWTDESATHELDNNLAALAMTQSPAAKQAAALIGKAHRLHAMQALSTMPNSRNAILAAYEKAGSLPGTIPLRQRIELTSYLALQELTRQPSRVFGQYLWAALGSVLGVSLMIYAVYTSNSLFSNQRIRTAIGLGLLYGLMYAVGIWLTRHIARHLSVLPPWARIVLAALAGGIIVALGFSLFQQLVYEDQIDLAVSLGSGILFVAGFAISVRLPTWAQMVSGMAGIIAALLIPWMSYLNDGTRPPFIFNEDVPESAVPLVIVAAALITFFTLGSRWRGYLSRNRNKTIS